VDEEDIDDDSIDLTFKHDDAKIELELYDRSGDEVSVSMDCEGLDFTGSNDPAALVKMGIPQPQSYLFLQKNIQLPKEVIDLEYERDRLCFKSRLQLQASFDHFSTIIKKLGYQESRKPILDDDRHYTEFEKGPIELSINIFTDDYGTRLLIGYQNEQKEKLVPPLPAVGAVASKHSNDPSERDTGSDPDSAKPPAITAVDISRNKGEAVITFGNKKYIFKHVAAYQTQQYGSDHTRLTYSTKPIPLKKLQTMISTDEDFSFGDMFEFDLPDYFSISLDQYVGFSFSADGMGIGRGIEDFEKDMTIENGRIQATIKMMPEEIFDKPFSFVATADAGLMTPHTRVANFTDPPPAPSPEEQLGISDMPMPEGAEDIYSQGSRYRKVTHAKSDQPRKELATFYRTTLTADGWQEDESTKNWPANAEVPTAYLFRKSGKSITVKLPRVDGQIAIEVATRDDALAKSVGILPETGKGRLVMGNAHTKSVVIAIGKRNYTLKPSQGADNPKQALNYSVGPGTYTLTIKIPGQQPQVEKVTVGEGTTWGIIALPTGGYFASQLY